MKLIKANERRQVEQTAAWESIEAKTNLKDGGQKDKYVSATYMK